MKTKNRETIHENVMELLSQVRSNLFDQVNSMKTKYGKEIGKTFSICPGLNLNDFYSLNFR